MDNVGKEPITMKDMKGLGESGEVILYVTDMASSVRFWNDQVGLEIISHPESHESWIDEHWVVLDAGGFNLCLHPGGIFVAESHSAFSLLVDDLEAALAGLSERGINHSGVLNPHPGVVFAELRDPDGHLFFVKPIQGA